MTDTYVHGHGSPEHERLGHQADALAYLLHPAPRFPPGSAVLEAGCGVGAQTGHLARMNPGALITAVDVSEPSLAAARARARSEGFGHVGFLRADICALPFSPASFDHVFLCFVLEHLPDPGDALARLAGLLRPGGTLTAVEGDHGSALIHPDSGAARRAIAAQVELQRRAGGDALIGRRLQPLLAGAGLDGIRVAPRTIYADAGRPDLAVGFVERTFMVMIAGVRGAALAAGLADADDFDAGLAALRRAAAPGGTFAYTFFEATGRRPAGPRDGPGTARAATDDSA